MKRFWRVSLAVAAVCLASPTKAQTSTEAEQEALFVSPIPKVRVIRPAEPEESAENQDTGEDTTQQQTETQGVATDTDLASDEAGSTQTTEPQDGSMVRVVFGGSSINQNTRVEPEDPEAEAEAEAEDSNEPRWKRERSRRFRRAPQRSDSQGQGVQIAAPIVPIETPDTDLQGGARLRQLDKMTGLTETFDIAVGETRLIARLQIRLDACRSPENNDVHGTMAFMQIWDTKRPEDPPSFSGWMFAESPALSALDHPRYDLWVINCTTSSGENSASTE